MVAGGVGLAPFAALAEALARSRRATTLFYGARTSRGALLSGFLPRRSASTLELTTEDGSVGERGRIVRPLERRLRALDPAAPVMIYACGPEGMLAATARVAAQARRPCEVSVERIMGCGMGGCYSCVVPMRGEHGRSTTSRSCLAGPVLRADQNRVGLGSTRGGERIAWICRSESAP